MISTGGRMDDNPPKLPDRKHLPTLGPGDALTMYGSRVKAILERRSAQSPGDGQQMRGDGQAVTHGAPGGHTQAGFKLSGRYALDALLGRGGMGEVWRGVDEHLDRPVAVKVLREHLADPELAGRFRREARIAGRLQHPGITVVHDVGSDNGQLFIVMELLHGRDLAAMLAEAPGGLAIDTVVSLTIQAAEALQAAHAMHVVHRDLKPANLFVLDSGQLKICDFGIAWAVDSTTRLTAAGQAIGTPAYMSPEQCQGQQVDARSDLYSLGCVLYELLTGRPPFAGGHPLAIMAHHLNTRPAAPRTIRLDIPPELDHLVLDLLAKDPASRPADASHVIAALQALLYTPTMRVELDAKVFSRMDLVTPESPGEEAGFQPIDADGTMSANLAGLPNIPAGLSAPITRVPRSEAERRQVLLTRPYYWEYLYFAAQLLYERNSIEAKYRDQEFRYAQATREFVVNGEKLSAVGQLNSFKETVNYISMRFDDLPNLTREMTDLIKDEAALEQAFGAPGEEGDAERLADLAKHWNSTYEGFLDWAASLRGVRAPSEFKNLLELAARFADEPVTKYHRFVDEYTAQVDGMYDAIPAAIASGKPISLDTRLVLSAPEEAITDYTIELNRLRSQLYLTGDL
jgi:serine/threonine protein kinase